jgi:hypothetical protein
VLDLQVADNRIRIADRDCYIFKLLVEYAALLKQ